MKTARSPTGGTGHEIVWPRVEPKYSTLKGIMSNYSYMMRGHGRVGLRRFSCWCPACCLAHESGEGMNARRGVTHCARKHLTQFSEQDIKMENQAGLAYAAARAKDLWGRLKARVVGKGGAGKFVAVQATELWSTEERVHMRPGHHWVAELGDAGGGSPVLKGPFTQRETYEGQRYDPGEYALLLRRYYHRTADDRLGLTFKRWEGKKGEKLIVNSSKVRGVGFKMALINPPVLRSGSARGGKGKGAATAEPVYSARQKWHLDKDVDAEIRVGCEAT